MVTSDPRNREQLQKRSILRTLRSAKAVGGSVYDAAVRRLPKMLAGYGLDSSEGACQEILAEV